MKIGKMCMIAMAAMAVVSFANLFGLRLAGISVCLGILFFFVNKSMEKQPFAGSGLELKAIGKNLKERSVWFWIAMPLIMDVISIAVGNRFLPGYSEHILARTEAFISLDKLALTVVQLAVLALGEEIAWRAFFQKQLKKALPIAPVLMISSLLFAMGHISEGGIIIVVFDVFFVFINSVLYGVIFHKTNNAWIGALSHFTANLISLIVLLYL